jgi:hypothetical protein
MTFPPRVRGSSCGEFAAWTVGELSSVFSVAKDIVILTEVVQSGLGILSKEKQKQCQEKHSRK